eukprot:142636-Pelagomonas_calceolata.AAC.2
MALVKAMAANAWDAEIAEHEVASMQPCLAFSKRTTLQCLTTTYRKLTHRVIAVEVNKCAPELMTPHAFEQGMGPVANLPRLSASPKPLVPPMCLGALLKTLLRFLGIFGRWIKPTSGHMD